MDRLSIKVLKLLKKEDNPTHEDVITRRLGPKALKSLKYLKDCNYIDEGKGNNGLWPNPQTGRMEYRTFPNKMYELAPLGKDFLQSKPGTDFDRWITRICAIIGAITGVSALIWEIVDHLPVE